MPAASRSTRLRARGRKARSRCVKQSRCRRVVEAGQPVLGQPRVRERRRVTVARGGQQENRVGLDPPSNEREHVCGRAVEPVGVIDDEQHRRIGRDLRDEVERGHRDPVVLRHNLVRQSEGGVKRVPLTEAANRQHARVRAEHLMQIRKRQMGFGLRAGRGEHGHASLASRSRGLRQQTRLADTRLAAEHERSARAADVIQQPGQDLDLVERPQIGARCIDGANIEVIVPGRTRGSR